MTPEEKKIDELGDKVFRFECEKLAWRRFRKIVEDFESNHTAFGFNTDEEWQGLKQELESIKYY